MNFKNKFKNIYRILKYSNIRKREREFNSWTSKVGFLFKSNDSDILFKRDKNKLLKNWELVHNDGFAQAAIWQLTMSIWSEGYSIEEDKNIKEFLDNLNFLEKIIKTTHACFIFGDGFLEIVKNKLNQVIDLKPIFPLNIEIKNGEYIYIRNNQETIIPKDRILHIKLFPTLSIYGHSLVSALHTLIKNRISIDEATHLAIKRHGFPKYHIKVGRDERGRSPPDEVFNNILWNFRELNEKNEFISTDLITIQPIDTTGIPDIEAYQQYLVNLIATSSLLPIEILGMAARGSTEATAKARLEKFDETIKFFRRTLESQINAQLISQISKVAKFKIIDKISEREKQERSRWIARVIELGILTKNEIRQALGYPPLETGGDELVYKHILETKSLENKETKQNNLQELEETWLNIREELEKDLKDFYNELLEKRKD